MFVDVRPSIFWKCPPLFWVLLALIVVLAGLSFQYTVLDMLDRWNTQEEYGYGYLIPVITLFLIWQRKNQLAEIEFNPSWWGLVLVILGGVLLFLGMIATTHTLSQYGLVITVLGIALALLGWNAFKIVMVPLALLFFMVPLPPFIYNTLSTKLQLISSDNKDSRGFGCSVSACISRVMLLTWDHTSCRSWRPVVGCDICSRWFRFPLLRPTYTRVRSGRKPSYFCRVCQLPF